MARIAKLWWDGERKQWCVVIHGRRHRLGRDRAAAVAKWHQLMGGSPHSPPPPSPSQLRVGELIDRYSAALPSWGGRDAVLSNRYMLRPFRVRYAKLPVSQLTVAHFDAVVKLRGWGQSTRSLAKRRWAAACNWAKQQGMLTTNPLAGMRTGTVRPRGVEVLPTKAEWASIQAAANPRLLDVLLAIYDTGCRPSEVLSVTAAEFDAERGEWIMRKSKTAKQRRIVLTERLRRRCETLRPTAPSGPLFEFGRSGCVEYRSSYLSIAFRRLCRRIGVRSEVTVYSLRHLLATELLAAGTPDAVVAELLGNSVRVLHRHYAHLVGRPDALREALRRIRGSDQS